MREDELFELRKRFGLLFQDGALFGSMNIYDNTAFPLRMHTEKAEDEIAEIVNRRLKEVGLGHAADEDAERALGRDAQAGRLRARARARPRDRVLRRARLGPRSGAHRAPVRARPGIHAENKGCYVIISHHLGTARTVADYIAVLWRGRIVESGPADELFNSENQFVRQFLNAQPQGPLAMD